MNLVSDGFILIASVVLGYAAVKAVLRMPIFGVREVVVMSSAQSCLRRPKLTTRQILLCGETFSPRIWIRPARRSRVLPWVRKAQLRRPMAPLASRLRWRSMLPWAYWHSTDTLGYRVLSNSFGELFDAASNADHAGIQWPGRCGHANDFAAEASG